MKLSSGFIKLILFYLVSLLGLVALISFFNPNYLSESTWVGSNGEMCLRKVTEAEQLELESLGTLPENGLIRKSGFCFPAIWGNWESLLAGRYPREAIFRPTVSLMVLGLCLLLIFLNIKWNLLQKYLWLWALALLFIGLNLGFGKEDVGGWQFVPFHRWGGLLLTGFFIIITMLGSFPVGYLMSWLISQRYLPMVSKLILWVTDLIRSVPLITLLLFSHYLLPLVFPNALGGESGAIPRALFVFLLFGGSYLCEILRSGLATLPKGQAEASYSLGLSPWQAYAFVLMPQSIRVSLPSIVGTFVGLSKDATLLGVLSLHELMGVARNIASHPKWNGFDLEPVVFAAVVYLVICRGLGEIGNRLIEINKVN